VSGIELICGVLIITGLFSRLAALPLVGVMIVALLTAKLEDITSFSALTETTEYLYLVILFWLAANKSEFLSLNSIFKKSCTKLNCSVK
jgi:putative oxidoreductase